jgi:hypothetical protein
VRRTAVTQEDICLPVLRVVRRGGSGGIRLLGGHV